MQLSPGEPRIRGLGPDPRLIDERFANGARLLVLPTGPHDGRPSAPVSIELWVMAGTAAESPSEHGCAHLLEHMVFKPTTWEGQGLELATAVETLGGDVNAYTSHDETVFHATVPASVVEAALPALIAPVLHPRFDPAELRREIDVVLEEIKQYDDDLASRASQDLLASLLGNHGYARPVLGTRREVAGHDVERLQRFHREVYTADRATLVVVGPVDPERIRSIAQDLLGGLPRKGRRVQASLPSPPHGAKIRVQTHDAHEAHLAFGWIAPALPDRLACALDVASVVLGYGEASRLAVGARRRSQAVTDAQAHFYASRWGSSLVVSANTPASRAQEAVSVLWEEIQRLRAVPIDDTELARARAMLQADVVYRRETVQGQAHALGYQLSLGGDLHSEARYFEALGALTPSDLLEAAQEFLIPARTAIHVILPRQYKSASRSLASAVRTMLRPPPARARRPKLRERDGITKIDFPGGFRVRAKIDRSIPMTAGWMVWNGGLRAESTRDLGASPLIASLLTRGCGAIDGDRLAQEVEGVAASLDGFSGRNSMGLQFECLAPHAPLLLRRMFDCALDPQFRPDELDEERRVALEELDAEDDDPAGLAFRAAYEALYRGHPFARRRHGTASTLERLSSARLKRLWHRDYPIGQACLGLAGDLDLDALLPLIAASLPEETSQGMSLPPQIPRYPQRPVFRSIPQAKEQAHLVLAFPGLRMADARVYALDVLTTLLGGQVGRLFESLRERQGLVYNVSVSSMEGTDAGHLAVYAATSPAKLQRALASTREQLRQFCEDGPRPEEISRTQAWLVAQHDVEMQRRSRVASQLAFDEAYGLGAGIHLRYANAIMSVRREDLWALAVELFDPSRCVQVVVDR